MNKPVFLYLDDEIFNPDGSLGYRDPNVFYKVIGAEHILKKMGEYDVVYVNSFNKALEYIEDHGCPAFISFDNDLGGALEGGDLARLLVKKDLDTPGFIPAQFDFFVHSRNPVARKNIELLLRRYLLHRDTPHEKQTQT